MSSVEKTTDSQKTFQVGISKFHLFLVMLSNVFTETYNIKRFNTAEETIQAVEDRYNVLKGIKRERVNYVNEFFHAVDVLHNEQVNEKSERQVLGINAESEQLQEVLSPESNQAVTEELLYSLIEAVLMRELWSGNF